jgi:hypothetical protein
MNYSIYIYNLHDLQKLCSTFPKLPPELELFDHFTHNLKKYYTIVENIDNADMAFIPIDFTKLLYSPQQYFPPNYPKLAPVHGVIYKKNNIKYFWDLFVAPYIKCTKKTKHFIFYSYVLYDISFEYIPNDIYIFAYENKLTITSEFYSIETTSKLVPIPYPLNDNFRYNQKKILKYKVYEKKYNIGFFGNFNRKRHLYHLFDLVKHYRQFITKLSYPIMIESGKNAVENLPKLKYLFVLRGDTPTRLCFYQCFAYGVIPIIFEKELDVIQKLLCPEINIKDSCFVLPNKENKSDEEYANIVDELLKKELGDDNNYLNRVKNHNYIFDNFNWFKEDDIPKPVENIINYLGNK